MEILIIISVIVVLAIILVVSNVLMFRWIVSRALNKFIRPYFMDLQYKVQNVEFVGLFKTGDFKRSGFPLRPFMHSGKPTQTTYVYVYLSKNVNHQVRITAKINTVFLFIKKVEYSELPKS